MAWQPVLWCWFILTLFFQHLKLRFWNKRNHWIQILWDCIRQQIFVDIHNSAMRRCVFSFFLSSFHFFNFNLWNSVFRFRPTNTLYHHQTTIQLQIRRLIKPLLYHLIPTANLHKGASSVYPMVINRVATLPVHDPFMKIKYNVTCISIYLFELQHRNHLLLYWSN